ncbi:unnamed protein product [Cylicostephanus goldi]|uniref:Uncharacterized protein n=1 Tax=Cylicostephanus goldi TaxID=71465 RepID=A0A3P7QF71_CYLGO|nr:unnamed protein product [Cylicostephanus goldi]
MSDIGRYVLGNCEFYVTVLQDKDKPLLELDSKIVERERPMGEIVTKWSIKNIVPSLERSDKSHLTSTIECKVELC